MKERINQIVDSYSEKLVEYRRYLHENPELSFREVHTSAWIKERLQNAGIDLLPGISGNSVVGVIDSGLPGPCIAFRADIDALPIQEEMDVPYKSKVANVMHACGHDAHTAILLCLAEAFSANRDLIKHGSIRFLFQQAEEVMPGGASYLVKDGVMKDVDRIFGLHISNMYETGTIACTCGPTLAATSNFEIVIKGQAGHAAFPHKAVDTITPGCAVISELNQLVTKATSAQETLVINVTQFIAGDKSPVNVVPDTAILRGTIRTHNNTLFREMQKKVGEVAAAVCAMKGCTCQYHCDAGYPAVVNTAEETQMAWDAIEEMGYHAVTAPANMGGEDFAYYLLEKPGCYLKLGVSNATKGITVLPHNCRFTLDEDAMLVGMKVFMATYLNASK